MLIFTIYSNTVSYSGQEVCIFYVNQNLIIELMPELVKRRKHDTVSFIETYRNL